MAEYSDHPRPQFVAPRGPVDGDELVAALKTVDAWIEQTTHGVHSPGHGARAAFATINKALGWPGCAEEQ